MAKRSLQQIEESLRARLDEAGARDADHDGIPDDEERSPLLRGSGWGGTRDDPVMQIAPPFPGGGGGRGSGTAPGGGRPKVWRRSEAPKTEPIKTTTPSAPPTSKPRVQMKPGETQDQAMLRIQREKIAKDRNDQVGAKVWRPGEGKPKVWRRGKDTDSSTSGKSPVSSRQPPVSTGPSSRSEIPGETKWAKRRAAASSAGVHAIAAGLLAGALSKDKDTKTAPAAAADAAPVDQGVTWVDTTDFVPSTTTQKPVPSPADTAPVLEPEIALEPKDPSQTPAQITPEKPPAPERQVIPKGKIEQPPIVTLTPPEKSGTGKDVLPGTTGDKSAEKPGVSSTDGTGERTSGSDYKYKPGYLGREPLIFKEQALSEKYQEFKSQLFETKLDADSIEQLRQDPRVRVMLDLLGRAESATYDTLVGHPYVPGGPSPKKVITDFSDHPRNPTARTKEHGPSAAAGKFQIVPRTWDGQVKKLTKNGIEIKGFYPPDQEKVAISILNDIGALDAVLKGNYKQAVRRSASQWMSLPGTHMPQGRGPHDEKWVANQLADIKKTYGVETGTDGTKIAQANQKTTEPKQDTKSAATPGYYAVGDSQAQGVAGYGGEQWNKNMAYRGASILDPKQFKTHLANIEKIPPGSVVAISGGGNDINSAKPEKIVDRMNKLIAAAKARGLQVVHLLPTESPDPKANQKRQELRQAFIQGQTLAPIMDLGIASKKDPQKLHLDRNAYQTIANNITNILPIGSATAGELPTTNKPIGTLVKPDWSKYNFGDQGTLEKIGPDKWRSETGKIFTNAPELEVLPTVPKPESFTDKLKRVASGELVSQVFGDKKKPTPAPVRVEPKTVIPAAPAKKGDEESWFDQLYGIKAAKEKQARIAADVAQQEAERKKAAEKSTTVQSTSGVIDYSRTSDKAPTASPEAPKTKVDPAYTPGTDEYDARMEKLQTAAGDKFSQERTARLEKERQASKADKSAEVTTLLQKDQKGLTKAKRELSDFEKEFALQRAKQGPGGEFTWTDPKTNKTTKFSTLYKGEKPPASTTSDQRQTIDTPYGKVTKGTEADYQRWLDQQPKTASAVPADQSLDTDEKLVDVPAVTSTGTDRFKAPVEPPPAPAKSEIQKAIRAFDKEQNRKERIDMLMKQANEPSSTSASKTADELATDELMKDIRAHAAGRSPEEISATAKRAEQELDAAIAADQAAANSTTSKPYQEPTELPGVELKGSTEPYTPPVDVSIDSEEQARRQAAKDAVNDELKESINNKLHAELHDILRLAGRLK